jgi:hypothetical protein
MENYKNIPKESTFVPSQLFKETGRNKGERLVYENKNKILYLKNLEDYKNYKNTMPATLNYNQCVSKSKSLEDWRNTKIKPIIEKIEGKIKIRCILNTIKLEIGGFTESQLNSIKKDKVDLPKLLSHKITSCSRIKDYRERTFLYYNNYHGECSLCNEDNNFLHILNCKKMIEWEKEIGINENDSKLRIESSTTTNKYHTYAWIQNWCLWKTFTSIEYGDKKIEDAKTILKRTLKLEEYSHLRYLLSRIKDNKRHEIELFKYFTISNNDIVKKY